jgi:hypothetical protein
MTNPIKTVDNLGPDASNRYANDQKEFDRSFITESGKIPSQTQIDVLKASYRSEMETLFGLAGANEPLAMFQEPMGYAIQKKRLFTHTVVPALASMEMMETQVQRIKERVIQVQPQGAEKWEIDLLHKDVEREQKTLLNFFSCANQIAKDHREANSKRGQFSKG